MGLSGVDGNAMGTGRQAASSLGTPAGFSAAGAPAFASGS